MSTNYDRQAKLAESAPLPELQALSKGANPRLVQPFVALGALNARMAQMQSDKMLQGAAAPGSMPTLKDKIEQSIAQMKAAALARQQNAQSPGMFQVAENTPEPNAQPEAQYYDGGVARLPVRDNMFGYAGGGIIAFNGEEQSDVPEGLTREEAEAIRRRMKQRTDMTPEKMDVTDLDFTSIPGMEKSDVLAKALAAIPKERKEEPREEPKIEDSASKIPGQSVQAPVGKERLDSSELGRNIANTMAALPGAGAVKGFFGGVRGALGGIGNLINKENGENLISNSFAPTQAPVTGTVVPAPTGKPELQKSRVIVDEKAAAEQDRLAKAHAAFQSGQKTVGGYTLSQAIEKARERLEAEGKKLTPDDVRVIQRRFEGATPDAGSGGIKTLPEAKPAATNVVRPPVATPTTTSTPDQTTDWMAEMKKALGPLPAVETPEQRIVARDRYVNGAPDSAEAVALLRHFDTMAKRYAANDQAEEAQKAINARNNLWSFLSNTRGSSLGVAAGKANAALQPLLADQETRRQNYQKQRDEQEMLLGKARYELAKAERERKEGRYSDAEKSEQKAKELQEQARGHIMTGIAAGMRNEETTRQHKETMARLRASDAESARRWQAEQEAKAEVRAETERNNRMRNRSLARDVEREINKQKEELKRYAGAGNEKIIVEKRAAIEQRIKELEGERKDLLDEIKMPSGYDPSKVKRK